MPLDLQKKRRGKATVISLMREITIRTERVWMLNTGAIANVDK
tara:strand:+ start:523 stop:651 length:129 start_codon:yes stop_codon:yes gene_type:complete